MKKISGGNMIRKILDVWPKEEFSAHVNEKVVMHWKSVCDSSYYGDTNNQNTKQRFLSHPSNGSSMHKCSWHPQLRPHHGPGRTSGLFGQAGNPGNGHRQSERRFPFQEPAGLRSLPSSFSGPKKFRLVGPWSHQRPSTWPLMV